MELNLKKIDLVFDDEGGKHIHLLNGGEVPGCTSISGLFQDDGWKFAWPVKLMEQMVVKEVNHLINEQADQGLCMGQIEPICAKAKNAWREKRDRAADSGTKAHGIIENYIKTGLIEYFAAEVNSEVLNCIDEFLKWTKLTKPEWIASELQVGSETHNFAGILDAACVIDGKTVLLDFKTSASGDKPEYAIQLAGLHIALSEMGFIPDERAILHLPKKGEYSYIPITSDLEKDKAAFLAGLEFYKHKNLFMGRCK